MIPPEIIDLFRVAPGKKLRLKDRDPGWAQTKEMKELGKDAIKERAQEIVDRYRRGQSVRAIAAALYVSFSTVRRVLVEQQVPLRSRGGSRPGDVRVEHRRVYVTALPYEREGWTMSEIAETLDLSVSTVHGRLQRAELPSRPRGPRSMAI